MGARDLEPATQRLTLKMRGQTSETPSKDDGPRPGVTVDNESLRRQQDLVRAGSASQEVDVSRMSPRTRSLRKHVGSPKSSAATTPGLEQLHSIPTQVRDPTGEIKDETPVASSQHLEGHPSQEPLGSLLDSTRRAPHPGDSKRPPFGYSCFESLLTLRPVPSLLSAAA